MAIEAVVSADSRGMRWLEKCSAACAAIVPSIGPDGGTMLRADGVSFEEVSLNVSYSSLAWPLSHAWWSGTTSWMTSWVIHEEMN